MRPPRWLALLLVPAQGAYALSLPGLEGGRAQYLPLVIQEATAQGIPPELADAVAMVETGYRPDAVGSSGEIGLMQVMPATARQLGFSGTSAELADPAINIALGVRYLARAWSLSGGDICRSLMKYRAGLGQELMTPLSAAYCTRAIAWLGSTGSRLASIAPLPDGGAAPTPPADPYVIAIVPALAARRPGMLVQGPPVWAGSWERRADDHSLALNHPYSSSRMVSRERRAGPSERSMHKVQAAVEAALADADP